jgi:hypothetical protein
MHEVGVGMVAAEIGQWHEVQHRALARAETVFEDFLGIGAGHGAHRVEDDAEATGQQATDGVEIEKLLHQRGIVGDGIDDGDRHALDFMAAFEVEIDVVDVGDLVAVDRQGAGEDRVGDLFRRGAAIADIVFDAEIFGRAAGIVAGRQHDAAEGLVFTDDVGGCGRRQDAAAADQHAAETVGGGHLDGELDDFAVVVPPVAADHQRLAGKAFQRIEDRLDEVLRIVRLLEDGHLLAQAGRAGFLVGVGCRRNSVDGHGLHSRKKAGIEVGVMRGAVFPGNVGLHALVLDTSPDFRLVIGLEGPA